MKKKPLTQLKKYFVRFSLIAAATTVFSLMPGLMAKPGFAHNPPEIVSDLSETFNNFNDWNVSYYNGGAAPGVSHNVLTVPFPPARTSSPFAATDLVNKNSVLESGSLTLSFVASTNKHLASQNVNDGFAVFCASDVVKYVGAEFGFIFSLDTGSDCVQGYLQDKGGILRATGLLNVDDLTKNHKYRAEAVLAGDMVTTRFYVDDEELWYINGSSEGWNAAFVPVITTHNFSGVVTKGTNLKISDLSFSSDLTMALFPDAPGDSTQLYHRGASPASTNWESVNNSTGNDTSRFVYNNTGDYLMDLYNFEDSTVTGGSIKSVTLYVSVIKNGDGGFYYELKTKGSTIESGVVYPPLYQTTYSRVYQINPVTGIAWTWNDINDLQTGIKVYSAPGSYLDISQVYIVVEYTAPPA
ncbi:MAG: hypothetical protein ABR886_07200 [Dehalococcoidales bacterium]